MWPFETFSLSCRSISFKKRFYGEDGPYVQLTVLNGVALAMLGLCSVQEKYLYQDK